MAKKITKKELEAKITSIEREKNDLTKARDMFMKEAVAAEERFENFKVELFDMMRPESENDRVVVGWDCAGFPGREVPKRSVSKTQLARRIGRLVVIEHEYIELKDRTLPIPKMQVLADDRADRRNGGRGSGISMI